MAGPARPQPLFGSSPPCTRTQYWGFRTAFDGGAPSNGVVYLSGTYRRTAALHGLTVQVWKGPAAQPQDPPMLGLPLYFPSEERLLLENLTPTRGENRRTVGAEEVEKRLLTICSSRGEKSLQDLRERARAVAPALGLQNEFSELGALLGSILRSRPSVLMTRQGKAVTADVPYDSERLALFEALAQYLRAPCRSRRRRPAPPWRGATSPSWSRPGRIGHVPGYRSAPVQRWQRPPGAPGHERGTLQRRRLPHHRAHTLS